MKNAFISEVMTWSLAALPSKQILRDIFDISPFKTSDWIIRETRLIKWNSSVQFAHFEAQAVMPRPFRMAKIFSSRFKRREVARLLILLALLSIGAIIGFFLGRFKAAGFFSNKTKAYTSSPHASGTRAASCADLSVGVNCINVIPSSPPSSGWCLPVHCC